MFVWVRAGAGNVISFVQSYPDGADTQVKAAQPRGGVGALRSGAGAAAAVSYAPSGSDGGKAAAAAAAAAQVAVEAAPLAGRRLLWRRSERIGRMRCHR